MMMKVAVFTDLKTILIQEKPVLEIGLGEVLVKVKYCGICGSDVHGYLSGIVVPPGTVMGHECSGVVAEVGKGIHNFKPGDRVVIKPIAQCGECYWCQKGQYSLCSKVFERAIGINPTNDGGFAEFVLIRFPNEVLVKLPTGLSFKEAALADPLACSLHSVRMSRFKPGDRVVIIGAGMIGLSVLQFLKLEGAGKIIVLEVSSEKSRIAKEIGADVVFNPLTEGEDLRRKIFNLTDEIGADIVFECAGVPLAFQSCIDYVKKGGQVMVVGVNEKEVPINPLKIVLQEVEMKGILGFYDEFKYVIEFLEQKKINTSVMISDIILLDDIEERGFKRLISSRDLVKILVKPQDQIGLNTE